MMQSETRGLFTAQDLQHHMEIAGIERGELCLLPQASEGVGEASRDEVAQQRSEMEPEDLLLLDRCVSILAKPDRLLHVHINLGDAVVSRLALGNAQGSPGMWVGLRQEGEAYSILPYGDSELKYGLISNLAAQIPLGTTQIGCDLSTPAALTFLAVLDQYKRSHMLSMLNHVEPISIFAKEDIEQQLAGANVHDFRWLLPFVDKLMPLSVHQLAVSENASDALAELLSWEIIANMDDEAQLFDLEPITLSIAEGYRQKLSVACIGHTAKLATGELVHDIFILIRTPDDLLLTVLSGGEASLVGINAEELQNLLNNLLDDFPKGEDEAADEEQPTVAAVATDETDGIDEMIVASEETQPKRFCGGCGSAVTVDARFCRACGNKL